MNKASIKTFFKGRSGRSLLVAVAVLLIGLAVYLNYRWFYDPLGSIGYGDGNMEDRYPTSGEVSGDAAQENDYFTSAALTRQQSRDEAIDVLKLVTENAESSEEARAEAASRISQIALDIQNEANIETLVKAKGFAECVTVISEGAVSVVVQKDELKAADTAQILTIVYETTGISPDKVSIINKG